LENRGALEDQIVDIEVFQQKRIAGAWRFRWTDKALSNFLYPKRPRQDDRHRQQSSNQQPKLPRGFPGFLSVEKEAEP
jgi:hypothetical protein